MGRPKRLRPVSVAITQSEYDGLWHGYKTVGQKPNGKADVAHRTGRTREECEAKIRDIEDKMAAGAVVRTGRKPTVEAWFTTWLTDIAPNQPGGGSRRKPLAPLTLQDYWSRCHNWVFPHLGGLRLDQLDTDDLDRLYAAMYAAGKASAHVLKTHAMIRRGLSVAMQRRKVAQNVAAMIDNPGAPTRKRGRALSDDQAKTVLEVIDRRPDALRWKVGLAIGPRQGEVLAIRWAYLDLDEDGTVDTAWQIQRRKWRHGCPDAHACGAAPHKKRPDGAHKLKPCPKANRPGAARTCPDHIRPCPPPCPPRCEEHASTCPDRKGGGLVFCRPKTYQDDDAAHIVSLPWSLVEDLKEHRKTQVAARLHAGSLWEANDLVFCQPPNGRPLDPRADYENWQDILAEAGLERAGTHAIRRTAATLMLEYGEDLAVVQEALGHSDIRTTRGYTRVTKGLTRRAANSMDEHLFGGGKATDLATERRRRRQAASGE